MVNITILSSFNHQDIEMCIDFIVVNQIFTISVFAEKLCISPAPLKGKNQNSWVLLLRRRREDKCNLIFPCLCRMSYFLCKLIIFLVFFPEKETALLKSDLAPFHYMHTERHAGKFQLSELRRRLSEWKKRFRSLAVTFREHCESWISLLKTSQKTATSRDVCFPEHVLNAPVVVAAVAVGQMQHVLSFSFPYEQTTFSTQSQLHHH